MEIRVFKSIDAWHNKKHCFCQRVECPDAFDYHSLVSVFTCLFGFNCVIEVIRL